MGFGGRRLLVVGLALALAMIPRSASAHALLLSSDPAADATLDAPPAMITLTFSEPVSPVGRGINVFSPSGHQVAGPVRVADRSLMAAISSAETGTYVATWQVLAADTHPSRGAFRFVIGRPSANPYAPLLNGGAIGTATPLGFVLQAVARWMHFVGVALSFGVVAYQIAIRPDARLRRPLRAGVTLLIVAEPVALIAQLASLSFDGDTGIALLASGFGRLLGLRLAVAILVWALLGLDTLWPVLGLGAVMALIDGATAHTTPGLGGIGPLLGASHVASMAIWVGGLTGFLFAPDRRFTPYAVGAFALSVCSGLLLAFAHLGSLGALVTTDYGRALAVKIPIVVAAAALALLGRRRIETGVVAVILAMAAVLVSLPPPR